MDALKRCHFYPFLIKIFFSKLRALDWWSRIGPECVKIEGPFYIRFNERPGFQVNMRNRILIEVCDDEKIEKN